MATNLSFDDSSVRAVPKFDTSDPIVGRPDIVLSTLDNPDHSCIYTQSCSSALFDCHYGGCYSFAEVVDNAIKVLYLYLSGTAAKGALINAPWAQSLMDSGQS